MPSKNKIQKIIKNDKITEESITDDPELKYIPIIVKFPHIEESIFDTEANVLYDINIDYPRGEYGFHHFIHATKNKLEILKKFEGKKKVYLVMNKFERYIDNYDQGIGNISKKYFKIDNMRDILSGDLNKIWEILLLFDLIDQKSANFVSAHLTGQGSFIQATINYRNIYCTKDILKNDKYHAIPSYSEDLEDSDHMPQIENDFIEYHNKENPQKLILHKPKKNTDKQISEKADFITSDCSFEWIPENVQEQKALKLIFSQIVTAVKIQKKDGNFVCKFFETFTKTSIKLVSMLLQLYNNVYFVKPLTSDAANSEKYAVCIGFKYDDKNKNFKHIIEKLDDVLKMMNDAKELKIVDIFSNYKFSKNLLSTMICLNRTISNQQLKNINGIVSFVKKEIYFGDEYHDKKDEQIEGSKYWIDLFLSPITEKHKKKYKILKNNALLKSTNEIKELNEHLVNVNAQN